MGRQSERESGVWNWLSGMDSNHDKELQRLLCYHYTTGQQPAQITGPEVPAQRKNTQGFYALVFSGTTPIV
jgi:hypothetical protein